MTLSKGMKEVINDTYASHIRTINGKARLEKLIKEVSQVCQEHKPTDSIQAITVHAIHAELLQINDQIV